MSLALISILSASAVTEATQERQVIDLEQVQYVEINQNGEESEGFRLSNSQAQELITRWNQARSIGLCKFFAKYIIRVHGKNGETRTFRATEDTMKEGNDHCFVLEDEYIGTVWKSKR